MNRTYGYCRISTAKQNISRQIRNITRSYPDARIIEETYTGTTTDRPAFDRMLRQLQSGDTVVFDSVSRMSRNAQEGFALYKQLYDQGIRLIFLKEPQINTDTYRQSLQTAIPMTGTAVDPILEGVNAFLMSLPKHRSALPSSSPKRKWTISASEPEKESKLPDGTENRSDVSPAVRFTENEKPILRSRSENIPGTSKEP